jgi:hypothetical protein
MTTTAYHDGNFMFSEHENGAVKVFSTARCKSVQQPYSHPDDIAILFLVWGEKTSLLASVDRTGHINVHQLRRSNGSKEPFVVQQKILDCTASSAVREIPQNHMEYVC